MIKWLMSRSLWIIQKDSVVTKWQTQSLFEKVWLIFHKWIHWICQISYWINVFKLLWLSVMDHFKSLKVRDGSPHRYLTIQLGGQPFICLFVVCFCLFCINILNDWSLETLLTVQLLDSNWCLQGGAGGLLKILLVRHHEIDLDYFI